MSDPSNIPIVNPNSNPTEPSKNVPADPEKFKKLLKVDESEEAQKRQKRNLKKEDEEEEKVEKGSTPKAGLFEGLLKKKEKKESIFDLKKPSNLKTKKTEGGELLEFEKPNAKGMTKAQAEEKQKKIDQVSEADSGEFFFTETGKRTKKIEETPLDELTSSTKKIAKEQKAEIKEDSSLVAKEVSEISPTIDREKPLKKYSEEELTTLKQTEEQTKPLDKNIESAPLDEKLISSTEAKQIQPVEESLSTTTDEKKALKEEPLTTEKEQFLSKDVSRKSIDLEETKTAFTQEQSKSQTEEVAQVKDAQTIKREETVIRTKEEKKAQDIAKVESEKKISSKEEDQVTTQASTVHEETKQILTEGQLLPDEGFSKTPEDQPSLIQPYLETVPVEPVHEIPPYSKLTPEVFDIFQKMIGMISIVKEQGVDRTTVTINMPGSIFDKGNLIIEHFASAANSFNVQFEGDENAVNLFNDHTDDLVAALGHAKLNYSVNVKRAVLASANKKE